MRFVSWNVNGFRAVLGKGFMDYFKSKDADVFCLQEIKLSEGQLDWDLPGYHCYWNYAEKKGYSGTAVFSKKEPLSVKHGKDNEGRICALEYEDYYVVCVYTPNSQDGLARLPFRMEWDEYFRNFVLELDASKTVLICGDMNVAHKEIDIKNPKTNIHNAGFTIEERTSFSKLLDSGFTDTFRMFYPDLKAGGPTDSRPERRTWGGESTTGLSRQGLPTGSRQPESMHRCLVPTMHLCTLNSSDICFFFRLGVNFPRMSCHCLYKVVNF